MENNFNPLYFPKKKESKEIKRHFNKTINDLGKNWDI